MNSKSIREYPFVFVLILMLLFSSMIGTIVWAKPDKPEKPVSEPETANFNIWIGNGELASPEDVVLQPYDGNDYLLKEDWNDWQNWYPLPTKGKPVSVGWVFDLGAVNLAPGEEPQYPGTYDINDQYLTDKLREIIFYPIKDKEVLCLIIIHYAGGWWEGNRKSSDVDFWRFMIQWDIGTLEIPNPEGDDPETKPHVYLLEGETDMGIEPEGEYDETTDTWTILFDNVDFGFKENTAEPGWVLNTLWEGPLSFTVEIQRLLP